MSNNQAVHARCPNCWYGFELPDEPVKINDQFECRNCEMTFFVHSIHPLFLDQVPKLKRGTRHVWELKRVRKGTQACLKNREMICFLMDKAFKQGLREMTVHIEFVDLERYAAIVKVEEAR